MLGDGASERCRALRACFLCQSPPPRICFGSMASSLSFTKFVWKNLRRRRLRTLLTLGGISMAVGAFVGLVGFSRSFEQQWMQIYSSSRTDIAVIRGTFLNTSLDQSVTGKLINIPVVAQAAPAIINEMDLTSDENALVYGWMASGYQLDSLQILSGRRFRDGQPEVMLGDVLAQGFEEEARRRFGDRRVAVYGDGRLPRRLGAGGRRGDHAARPTAATEQRARQGVDDRRAPASCAEAARHGSTT